MAKTGRRRVGIFIAVVVVFHLLAPLSYYWRADPYDERFAWRMFSGVRMQQCRSEAFDVGADGDAAPVRLERALHAGWITLIQRGRKAVISAFLERQCASGKPVATRIVNRCTDAGGQALPPRRYEMQCGALDLSISELEP